MGGATQSPSILLCGDVDSDWNQRLHIGDEAIYHSCRSWLARRFPAAQIFDHSASPPSCRLRLIPWRHFFRSSSPALKREVANVDLVWLVGGGILNSLFPRMLYDRLALILAASAMGKPVVLTGQTLGPLNHMDAYHLRAALRHARSITVRDGTSSEWLTRSGIPHRLAPDDASGLEGKPIKLTGNANVGLSLRLLDSPQVIATVREILGILQEKLGPIQLQLLPHVIRPDGSDLEFMRAHFHGTEYSLADLIGPNAALPARPDERVKSLTSSMDFMISSRYHGALFSVTSGVRCVGIHEIEYSRRKLQGMIDLGWPNLHLVEAGNWSRDELRNFVEQPAAKSPEIRQNPWSEIEAMLEIA